MKRVFLNIGIAVAMLATASCSNENGEQDIPVVPEEPSVEEKMQADVMTRAEGELMSTGVDVGLYMQHYVDGKKADLYSANNYVNNARMKYSAEGWRTEEPIYWYDESSLTDIYAYAPYQSEVADSRKIPVGVPLDQSTEEGLANADLLWGRNLALNPTSSQIAITLAHLFSRVTIKIKPEADFAEGEVKASDLKVFVNNVKCEGTLDLQTGEVTLNGDAKTVCAHNNGDLTFTAVVMPQALRFANLVRVEWDDVVYVLQGSISLEAKRSYELTISINKKEVSGLNIGIGGWDIDGKDYGGTVG